MLAELTKPQESLACQLQVIYQNLLRKDTLGKARSKAWDRFLEIGFPTRHTDGYQAIKLHELLGSQLATALHTQIADGAVTKHVVPGCEDAVLVFVNGDYCHTLSRWDGPEQASNGRMVVAPLSDAVRTYGAFLNNRWTKALAEEADPFAAVNAAAHGEGCFIYLPPNTIVDRPIHLLHLIDTSALSNGTLPFLMPRLQVFVGAGSHLSLVSSSAALSGGRYWSNQLTDVVLDDNAHLSLVQLATDAPENSWTFDAVRASVKSQGSFRSTVMTDGVALTRHDYRIALVGPHAEVSLSGLALLSERNEAHCNIFMDHQAPQCPSRQLFKTVLDDRSRSSFEGKIYVHQAAQQTDAFQLNSNLLLSDKAHADSKPNLEIFADDVKASHGATFGQLDKEQLFYLKTRGYSDQQAKQVLIHGYCKDVIQMVPHTTLRSVLMDKVLRYGQ